ncbi:MAG: outer membrane beta-barrel protein [Pseudomonadota bacterium]
MKGLHNTQTIGALALGAVACLISVNSVQAAEVTGSVNARVGYSDNLLQDANDGEDTLVTSAGFALVASEETRRIVADVNTAFDYLNYDSDRVDNEWVGGFNGNLTISVIPERLSWMVRDSFGQQTADLFGAPNAGNRQDVNFFTAGPTLQLLPVGRNQLSINARYNQIDFELQDTDSERISVAAEFERTVGANSAFSLQAISEDIDVDGQLNEIRRQQASVGYRIAGNRTNISTRLGYTRFENGPDEDEGLLAQLDISRDVSANGVLTFSGGTRYSDQGDIFRNLQDTAEQIARTAVAVQTGQQFRDTNAAMSYVLATERTRINTRLAWSDEEFDGRSDLDNSSTRFRVSVRRELTRRLWVRAQMNFIDRDFGRLGRADKDLNGSLAGGVEFGRGVELSLEYTYRDRSSTNDLASFHENAVFLRIGYTPRWAQ